MDATAPSVTDNVTQPKLIEYLLYFLRLGTLGFGGPIALAGHMQKDLVDERKWVSSQDYVEGLAFSQLSPGPLARNSQCISAGSVPGRSAQRSPGPHLSYPRF